MIAHLETEKAVRQDTLTKLPNVSRSTKAWKPPWSGWPAVARNVPFFCSTSIVSRR